MGSVVALSRTVPWTIGVAPASSETLSVVGTTVMLYVVLIA